MYRTLKFIATISAATLLLSAATSCAVRGSGTAAGMTTGDIVNGMSRDQVYWILGSPEKTGKGPDQNQVNYYTVDGKRWQCVFKGNTLISHGPAA